MTNIFGGSWQLGEVSEDWKKVNKYHLSLQSYSSLNLQNGNRTTYPEVISSGRQKGLQEANTDSPKGNHGQPT